MSGNSGIRNQAANALVSRPAQEAAGVLRFCSSLNLVNVFRPRLGLDQVNFVPTPIGSTFSSLYSNGPIKDRAADGPLPSYRSRYMLVCRDENE